jgi:hypothetical protein
MVYIGKQALCGGDRRKVSKMEEERELEEDILTSFERGEWRRVADVAAEINRHAACAKEALRNLPQFPLAARQ